MKNAERRKKLGTQLDSLYAELAELSKKRPNDAVNKFKLGLINKILIEANEILTEEYRPFADFDVFNEDDVPTNSDVVVILAQYKKCFLRQEFPL